jgi:hypothetical protein
VEPYVIRQGDFLLQLAYKFGFDADAVWSDPANDDLRKLQPDPNILWPTDVLHIPAPPDDPLAHSLATGQTNTFVSNPPAVPITIRFQDPPLAAPGVSAVHGDRTARPHRTDDGRVGERDVRDREETVNGPVTLSNTTLAVGGRAAGGPAGTSPAQPSSAASPSAGVPAAGTPPAAAPSAGAAPPTTPPASAPPAGGHS